MDRIGDLDRLARSFERHLRAENKSPKTVATYGEAITQLSAHLAQFGIGHASRITRTFNPSCAMVCTKMTAPTLPCMVELSNMARSAQPARNRMTIPKVMG
jgi:hypothetical protein